MDPTSGGTSARSTRPGSGNKALKGPGRGLRAAGPAWALLGCCALAAPEALAALTAGSAGGPPAPQYWARVLPTGMQRLVVFKSDPAGDVGVALYLVESPAAPGLGIAVSPPWKVERAAAWRTADGHAAERRAPDAVAQGGSGAAQLRVEAQRCVVDVDLSLRFDGRTPGIAAAQTMSAHGVVIDGLKPPCT